MTEAGEKQRVLIAVKTYPTLSRKYGETVCTAGVREDGTWVRIYPVPFRRLDEKEQYSKYDWIDCALLRNRTDPRPETFRPRHATEMQPVGHMDTSDNWRDRRQLLLNTARVFTRLSDLIDGAKANQLSLAVFRPTSVTDFVWEDEERDWDAAKVREMREQTNQAEIFAEDAWRQTFKVIPKLPYSFSYRFLDGDEPAALRKVRQKYFDEFLTRDLHFFLGTTQQFHFIAPNPWVIVGVLPIPRQRQIPLL